MQASKAIVPGLAALLTAALVHRGAEGQVVYVDAAAPTGGNGVSWNTAYKDLQAALLANPAPREYRIAAGTFRPDLGTQVPSLAFFVNPGDRLIGGYRGRSHTNPDDRDPTVHVTRLTGDLLGNDGPNGQFRSDNATRVLQFDASVTASAATLPILFDGLTIAGGGGNSAAAVADFPDLTTEFVSCKFVENRGTSLIQCGSIILTDCVIADNEVGFGTFLDRSGQSRLTRCRIVGNRGTHNFHEVRGIVNFEMCLWADNSPFTALFNVQQGSSCTFTQCTFAHNRSSPGQTSIVRDLGGTVRVLNCLAWGNRSSSGSQPLNFARFFSCGASLSAFVGPNLIEGGAASITPSGCLSTALQNVSPAFVLPAGLDGDQFTWQDNNYHLSRTSPAIDRSLLTDQQFRFGYLDLDKDSPFDVPEITNTGAGFWPYADLGCYEYTPSQDCPADFNHSGGVTTQDVFDFLAAYFGGCI